MSVMNVTKTEICRQFGWTRYEFDRLAAAGMPVAAAAEGRTGTWRVDPVAVKRWLAAREAREADRQRLAREQREARLREEAERDRQAEERWQRAQFKRVADFATMQLYFEARCRAQAARFRQLDKDVYASEAYAAFQAEWPDPASPPSWWRLPSTTLDTAVELLQPYLTGKVNVRPSIEHLLPDDIDYTKPWPWRSDAVADRAGS
jgi:hypothetical protein